MNKVYSDGENVIYYNKGHNWHLMMFKAYKSQYTPDAYRLKYGDREVIADVSEIRPMSEMNDLIRYESNAVRTTSIETASGQELDDIGKLFGIPRDNFMGQYETDQSYRERLLKLEGEMADAALAAVANFGQYESD